MKKSTVARKLLLTENCEYCGDPDASYQCNPYESEIHDDDTGHWMCAECVKEWNDEV